MNTGSGDTFSLRLIFLEIDFWRIDLQSKCNSKNEDERQGQIELTHKIIRT